MGEEVDFSKCILVDRVKLNKLKKAVEILRASNAFYASTDSWESSGCGERLQVINDSEPVEFRDKMCTSKTIYFGGRCARQAEAKVKEVLGE
jgi:hypothetical protein